jgi:hypothetical protein
MSNDVLVIDPFAKTVELHALQPGRSILDQIRDLVGCQLLTTIKPAPHTILWLDNLGLLKGEAQRFWRMKDSVVRFAGRTVLTAVDRDGMPLPVSLPIEAFRAGIDWCEGARIERLWEELHVEQTDMGPWPRVVPMVEFAGDPPIVEELEIATSGEETPLPDPVERAGTLYWIVFEDDEKDDFHCRERLTSDDGQGDWTGKEARFETLEEVQAYATSLGLKFVLREKKDPAGVAGTMVQP